MRTRDATDLDETGHIDVRFAIHLDALPTSRVVERG